MREEFKEEIKFDKQTATSMYLEAHRKSVTATEEKVITDSLCSAPRSICSRACYTNQHQSG